MSQTVVYLVGGDNWVPCYVSVHSLLTNNEHIDIRIHIFSEENKDNRFFDNIDCLERAHVNFTVDFTRITQEQYDSMPEIPDNSIFPRAMYSKLLIPELLPDTAGKVLYLDTDTVVVNSLDQLFDIDLTTKTVAAAPDTQNMIGGLGVPLTKRYFNAGIMYINTPAWLDNDVTERCFDFIRKYKPKYMDQTALNAVLHRLDSVKIISPEYNLLQNWDTYSDGNIEFEYDWEQTKIIHYAGVPKPWQYLAEGDIHDQWLEYYRESPFDDYHSQHRNPKWMEYIQKTIQPYPRLHSIAECLYENVT